MIEALKSDVLVEKCGGRFKLCALIQRRLQQLLDGERPLIARDGRSDLEVVIQEILQDKITLELVGDSAPKPAPSLTAAPMEALL
jgi:DNA-directed RNA polymerase subunit omega